MLQMVLMLFIQCMRSLPLGCLPGMIPSKAFGYLCVGHPFDMSEVCKWILKIPFDYKFLLTSYAWICVFIIHAPYAAVNGHLELPLLKDRQRFDAISTSNLEVYKFRDWWILTYFIFGHGESSLNNIWSMVNLQRTCVLLFYYFLCLKANCDLEKTNQLSESSPNFIFTLVNLDPIIWEKRWIDGESWPNNFVAKVNRGEDLRWVGSRCPLMRALDYCVL